MIKKSVVTCSLMLIVCIVMKMLGYSYSTDFNKEQKTHIEDVETQVKEDEEDLFSFAEEMLPLGDKKIEYRLSRALKANSFSKRQTLKLHYRAQKYFPIIEPILEEYGIPEDFKYIPLVETELRHGLVSPRGATGVWQFMPQTARLYGLKVNSAEDQRNNLRLSTIAAAKYLRDLYKIFNNWTLVAAAYNVGEGSLKKSIFSQKKDNYFHLKLNRETAAYVYSLVSMKEVIEKPAKYGYKINAPRKLLAYQPN
ncbi:lytic transglycosylase domain-containing protein [Pseudopedobacter beijingensis]|uniref:Lytic transglycosylase domain-containing protein n=1 Tax=Pseudopedobacter beijingensis TaxID=1207056 RepID=A0ABW4I933_9SPHI